MRLRPFVTTLTVVGLSAALLPRAGMGQSVQAGAGAGVSGAVDADLAALWVSRDGLRPVARRYLTLVDSVVADGLDPADYRPELARSVSGHGGRLTPAVTRQAGTSLTRSALRLARDLLSGRVGAAARRGWAEAGGDEVGDGALVAGLQRALERGRLAPWFDGLRPAHPEYRALRHQMARLLAADEDPLLPPIGAEPMLERGDRGPRVQRLMLHLVRAGTLTFEDLYRADSTGYVMDSVVVAGLEAYQRRHGLMPDGVAGPATVGLLEAGRSDRVRRLRANLERWRWLPRRLGPRYLAVDIPAQQARLVEGDSVLWRSPVIVGSERNPTPLVVDRLRRVVFAPHWRVPHGIAAWEELPKMQRHPGRADSLGFVLYHRADPEGAPAEVDWDRLIPSRFPFRLVQEPGPLNALGRVKFPLDNPFSVYLHDTPNHGLFDAPVRALSHGCVRLARPMTLAARLTGLDSAAAAERVRAGWASGRSSSVLIGAPLPVYVTHRTVRLTDGGRLVARHDRYGYDDRTLAGLSGTGMVADSVRVAAGVAE